MPRTDSHHPRLERLKMPRGIIGAIAAVIVIAIIAAGSWYTVD